MTSFTDLNMIFDNLVVYFTGSYESTALLLIVFFLLMLLVTGIELRYAIVFTLPLVGFFVSAGWFGLASGGVWIVNIVLIVVSALYAFAIIRLTS